jgi:hypothetical protein
MNPIPTTHKASNHDRDGFWAAEAKIEHPSALELVKDYL